MTKAQDDNGDVKKSREAKGQDGVSHPELFEIERKTERKFLCVWTLGRIRLSLFPLVLVVQAADPWMYASNSSNYQVRDPNKLEKSPEKQLICRATILTG